MASHGGVHSVFLLSHAVRLSKIASTDDWIHAVTRRASFLAGAMDHSPVAGWLLSNHLVNTASTYGLDGRLVPLSFQADRKTLIKIATLIFEVSPPSWLSMAVVSDDVRVEFIPSADAQALEWLGADLEEVLRQASAALDRRPDDVALGIGRAAELVALSALLNEGGHATHVADISDRYGYDIEFDGVNGFMCYEVKGCLESTQDQFHLSRNEFDKMRSLGSPWRILQVKFSNAAITADSLRFEHVTNVRELMGEEVLRLAPLEPAGFRWEESCRMRPAGDAWKATSLSVPLSIELPSLAELAAEARVLHASRLVSR
jgi:hypothetical protein